MPKTPTEPVGHRTTIVRLNLEGTEDSKHLISVYIIIFLFLFCFVCSYFTVHWLVFRNIFLFLFCFVVFILQSVRLFTSESQVAMPESPINSKQRTATDVVKRFIIFYKYILAVPWDACCLIALTNNSASSFYFLQWWPGRMFVLHH